MSTKNALKSKILVTGSAGFIGSHVINELMGKGFDPHGVDDLSGGFLRNVSNRKRFRKLDLRDRKNVAAYIQKIKPEIIFHLAADATEGRSQFTPLSAVDRNLAAYINLLVPAIKYGLKKIVLVSSMSVYGAQQAPFKEEQEPRPEDVYGISKTAMEGITKVLADVHGFSYVIIRPHNVYGPRQNLSDPYRNVVGIFMNLAMQGKPLLVYGDGEQQRAFSYIDDIVQPMVASAFSKNCEGRILNLGSNEPVTLKKLAEMVVEESGKKLKIIHVPARPREVKNAFCSHAVAEELLGFSPKTDLGAGLKTMMSWVKTMGPQKFVYLKELELPNKKTPKTWTSKLF